MFVRKTLTTLAAVSLVAVGTASAAGAATRPDDRPRHGVGAVTATAPDVVRPDDRATHGPGAIAPITAIVAAAPSAGGFDWVDAGIGGAAVLGFGLLGLASSALVVRHRRHAAYS